MKKKLVIIIIVSILVIYIFQIIVKKDESFTANWNINDSDMEVKGMNNVSRNVIDDWRITLVNYENSLPDNFKVELANIDSTRQFDKRAINELLTMVKDAKKDGVLDIWVQSAYRSISYQQGLFDEKVNKYLALGKTREEAEKLTLQTINKPGSSEHNLGLAVDFNYVNYDFEKTKAFKWLQENAENYGFILRYRKDKESITKVAYEPWHWRYVGSENAKKINELDMCLEEYIKYIS